MSDNSKQQNQGLRESVRPASNPVPAGLYGIEVALRRNMNYVFPPTKTLLRGRYDSAAVAGFNTAENLGRLFREFPIIRGLCVEVNTARRTLRIYDPYRDTEEGRRVWKKLSPLLEAVPVVGSYHMQPHEEYIIEGENVTDDKIKDWMFECAAMIGKGKAIVLTGEKYRPWPSQAEIKLMPGGRWINRFSERGGAKQQLVDVV